MKKIDEHLDQIDLSLRSLKEMIKLSIAVNGKGAYHQFQNHVNIAHYELCLLKKALSKANTLTFTIKENL